MLLLGLFALLNDVAIFSAQELELATSNNPTLHILLNGLQIVHFHQIRARVDLVTHFGVFFARESVFASIDDFHAEWTSSAQHSTMQC